MKLVYFARVREAVGIDAEERELPANVQTVGDCIVWLTSRDQNYAAAFADPSRLRFALDQQMVSEDTLLEGASELAIFPPVTGG
ncbi:MAG TPA: molybdopterin converting factor subunit 1 [Sphingorhabdus sp.]|nr:molybdopterin converting factor subunit 1 [Sphingorhabdus sp.]